MPFAAATAAALSVIYRGQEDSEYISFGNKKNLRDVSVRRFFIVTVTGYYLIGITD